MTRSIPVSTFFSEEPSQWGLRGDPYLWGEMRQHFAGVECPDSADELVALIERMFEELTGFPLTHQDFFRIEKYTHGGMSSGMISPEFWRETAIPLLRRRYNER